MADIKLNQNKLSPFQQGIIDIVIDNFKNGKHTIILFSRQCGKNLINEVLKQKLND